MVFKNLSIGEKLRNLREARGLTLRGLSEALAKQNTSISHASLATWENGNGYPSRNNLPDICKFYNVEQSWLLFSVDSDGGNQEIVDAIATLNSVDRQIVIDFIEVLKKHSPEKYLRGDDE